MGEDDRGTDARLTFVPDGFDPPRGLATVAFELEPLGAEHNERDHVAWMSSIDHIRRTPGFERGAWPVSMTEAENLGDLERHARDFADRRGFTYTVLDPSARDVIGCVYIYPARADDLPSPPEKGEHAASVRSWVRVDRAELDEPLWEIVTRWLETDWPFAVVRYASRRS